MIMIGDVTLRSQFVKILVEMITISFKDQDLSNLFHIS